MRGLFFLLAALGLALNGRIVAAQSPTTDNLCLLMQPLSVQPHDDLDPQSAPDGQRVAFVGHTDGNPELYLLERIGGRLVNLSNAPEDDYQPHWSPDGRYLAYLRRDQPYTRFPVQVRLYDTQTGREQPVTRGYERTHSLTWVEGGGALLFITDGDYRRYEIETRQLTTLFTQPQTGVTLPNGVLLSPPSPAGDRILIAVNREGNMRPALLNTADGTLVETPLPYAATRAQWSPDGQFLLLVHETRLYHYELATGTLTHYDAAPALLISHSTWSPDGRIAWTELLQHHASGARTRFMVSGPRFEEPRELLQINHFIERIAWSPTRDQLAFQTWAGIYVVDVATGVFSELVQGLGKIQALTWSASGDYIASYVYSYGGSVGLIPGTAVVHVASGARAYLGGIDFAGWMGTGERFLGGAGRWGERDVWQVTLCGP